MLPGYSQLTVHNPESLFNRAFLGEMWYTDPRLLTDTQYKPLVKVDFANGDTYKITEIRLFARGDSFEGFPTEIGVMDSETGETYTAVYSQTDISVPSSGRAILYTLPEPLETAHLGIEFWGGKTADGSYLIDMLSEIEMIGKFSKAADKPEDGDITIDDAGLTLLDSSLFDVSVVFRDENSDQSTGKESQLFDGLLTTEWFPKTPVSAGYEYLKPFIKITFKGDKMYNIKKIRLFGKSDPKNELFPQNVAIASSQDGEAYEDVFEKSGINMISRDSISFSFNIPIETHYLGIELSEAYMISSPSISLPMLSEIKIFGEEIEYVDTNNLNDPDGEQDLDFAIKNEANQANITIDSDAFEKVGFEYSTSGTKNI